jgi:hypothetical protein
VTTIFAPRILEHVFTSSTAARNGDSLQNVDLNWILNIDEFYETLIAHLRPLNKDKVVPLLNYAHALKTYGGVNV